MLDTLCEYRSCYQWGQDKGTFVTGRGYTAYHKVPREVCMTNHMHGCPHDIPEPDPERARCCVRPRFAVSRGAYRQRCKTCGQWSAGWVLTACRSLPDLPSSDCAHNRVERQEVGDGRAQWFCPDCQMYWLQEPKLHALGGLTREQRFDVLYPWVAKMEKEMEGQ